MFSGCFTEKKEDHMICVYPYDKKEPIHRKKNLLPISTNLSIFCIVFLGTFTPMDPDPLPSSANDDETKVERLLPTRAPAPSSSSLYVWEWLRLPVLFSLLSLNDVLHCFLFRISSCSVVVYQLLYPFFLVSRHLKPFNNGQVWWKKWGLIF